LRCCDFDPVGSHFFGADRKAAWSKHSRHGAIPGPWPSSALVVVVARSECRQRPLTSALTSVSMPYLRTIFR
jgi:hypothetical protein